MKEVKNLSGRDYAIQEFDVYSLFAWLISGEWMKCLI